MPERAREPKFRSPPINCGGCGRFIGGKNACVQWDTEPGEYGTVLSRWPVACVACGGHR